ncbi:MAG: biopolymer transporter ExbD [Planctomycetales bacterium]|nr:biopolymer transporter ExbD [Planctomycetales bacterium]NIM07845.1 biopolymer transporter ExbD [Planctomycetales bacterium]NIN07337.1 biopolymer transporter ExbD [Planctomycetales bacterium]NIN76440.1 biopolymer transporter ExbD [Planctomycetales bacterium]NIO33636.1 biopolymer transporter ExbD [Planctomycetales bacterium]
MKLNKGKSSDTMEADLTPMIDIVFQLVAFFMVLVNFSQAEQDARVQLPKSALAIPPEESQEQPLTIQLAKMPDSNAFKALVGGDEIEIGKPLESILMRERRAFGHSNRKPQDVTVIVRAHKEVETGKVQEVITMCQYQEFERFRLRVEEEQ